jgi:hypothetical protein
MRITIRELSAAEKLTKNPEPQRKRRPATHKEKKEKIKSLESFSHRSNLWFLPSFSFTNKTRTTPFFKNAKNRERAKRA